MTVSCTDDRNFYLHLELEKPEYLKIMTAPVSMTKQFKIVLTRPTF